LEIEREKVKEKRKIKKMDDSLSSLLCQESENCLYEEVVDESKFIEFKNYDGSEDEYMEMLFEREICYGFKSNQSLAIENWLKCARLEAITWILKVCLTPFLFLFLLYFIEMD
jgi:hypothetical protein